MEEATDSSDLAKPHASLQAEEEEAEVEAEREEQVPQLNQDPAAIAAEPASTDSLDLAKPHASLQAEEEESEHEEQVPQLNQDPAAIAADSDQVPSLAAAPTFTRTKKKKKSRTLSLSEFHHYNEPSSRPTDAPPPPPTDPRHCSPACGSLKFNDDFSLFSRWPPWIPPFSESENEEMRSDGCNRETAMRPIEYERAGLAESEESKNPDPGSWSIWGNTELAYYSPVLYPPGTPPWVIMKMDKPVSVENPLDPSPSILGGGESSWPSLPGTNLEVVRPVIVQESPWMKGIRAGNGGQSNTESKESAEKEEEEEEEEANKQESTEEEANKEESREEAAKKEESIDRN